MGSGTPGLSTVSIHSPLQALRLVLDSGASGGFGFGNEFLSFPELDRRSNQCCHMLEALGVGRGDRVLGMIGNTPEIAIAWFATSKLGAIWVPVNTAYKGEWLSWPIIDSQPAAIVSESSFAPRFAELEQALPPGRPFIYVGKPPSAPVGPMKVLPMSDCHKADDSPSAVNVHGADLSHLLYTSGTTGKSKGCMVSHNYLVNMARLGRQNLPRLPEEVLWTALPLYHMAATDLFLEELMLGGTTVFAPQFSVSRFWDDVGQANAKIVSLMGAMLVLVATAPDCEQAQNCYGQVRMVYGGPFPPNIQQMWKTRFGVQQTIGGVYGMTEANFLALEAGRPPKEGSCGLPTESFDLRLVDEEDSEVAQGQVGQIVIRPRAPHVMFDGYWNNPSASWSACQNLWFHTGDYARMDEEGYLYFVDRQSDRMRRGAENVSSFEMEEALSHHPSIAQIAVHAVPSELGEDEIKATVVVAEGQSLTPEELCQYAIARVPAFAVPRYIEFRDQLPRNPTGKVLKYQLRAEGVTPRTWDRRGAGMTVPRL